MSKQATIPHPDTSSETNELRDQVRVLGDDVKELARLTKNSLAERVEKVRDSAASTYEAGVEKAGEYKEKVADATRENPFKALLIAAGAGALVGLILGRR